jgi:hypothetical protein
MNLLGTVAKALGNSRRVDMMASLDHSMWFYEPFDFNKPMVFFMQCQVSSQGRGLAMGRFYSEDGTLLAVVVSWTDSIREVCLSSDTFFYPFSRRKDWSEHTTRDKAIQRHQNCRWIENIIQECFCDVRDATACSIKVPQSRATRTNKYKGNNCQGITLPLLAQDQADCAHFGPA